jgi:IclR family pca regulon transcriptional regulator
MESSRNFVISLSRGLSVLGLLSERTVPLSSTELSSILKLSKSAIQRLTFTLEKLGYLERDGGSKKFRLGPKSLSIGFSAMRNLDLKRVAYPFMKEIARDVRETVNLAVLDGNEIVYVERIVAERTLNVNVQIGSRRPLHSTSMGKVILAFLPGHQVKRMLEAIDLIPFTPQTITRKRDLRSELDRVKFRGYAIANEEMEIGVRSVAAPIRNLTDGVIAAVNIAGPTSRVSLKTLESNLSEKVVEMARRISLAVGYVEDFTVRRDKSRTGSPNVANAQKKQTLGRALG